MKVLQLNLNHCEAAQDLLIQSVRELQADIAILCEQYRNFEGNNWVSDSTGKAAIWSCGKRPFQEIPLSHEAGFTRVKIDGIYIYSCYAPPNVPLEDFKSFLDRLVRDARDRGTLIIAGDFNAWAIEWGSTTTNSRGHALLESLSFLNIVLCNNGNSPTFCRGEASSIIDITFISSDLMRTDIRWEVSEIYTHSDHQAILFELCGRKPRLKRSIKLAGWKSKNFDEGIFITMMDEVSLKGVAEAKATQLMNCVTRACNAAMPRRVVDNRHPPNYWWNEEISKLRKKCHRARRLSQRARGKENFATLQHQYNRVRFELKLAIKGSKRQAWKDLCNEVEHDPWGRPYRTVMSRLKRTNAHSPTCPIVMQRIVSTLFPEQLDSVLNIDESVGVEVVPPVTQEELTNACRKVGNNKAPGPDNIPNIALKTAIRAKPTEFLDLLNSCLNEGIFPDRWKKQRLVLLPKGKNPPEEPSSYRPICMLDTAGKILERIICTRLEEAVERAGNLAQHQYGFRKARSTIDAINLVVNTASKAIQGSRWKGGSKKYCAIVTLDIKNAFNSARWSCIMKALGLLGIPYYIRKIVRNYFQNRILTYNTDIGCREYKVSGGVPQGSVLGPLLWNIMYDGVFRLKLTNDAKLVGFADDVAVVVVAKFKDEAEHICNEAIAIIQQWLSKVGLQLAEHKTEAVLVTSRKKRENITIQVGNSEIVSKPCIKYLGITIDARLTFKEHSVYVSDKAAIVNTALSRLMPNIGGPRQNRRRLLASVVTSVLLYGAAVWAKALQIKAYSRNTNSVYRRCALRVICGFRTISDEAAYVVAGMPPIALLAKERQKIYHGGAQGTGITARENRNLMRSEVVAEWQQQWSSSEKGRWTFRLIPLIDRWLTRLHGEVDFHLTQLLTGHGCFRSYLFRFGHDDSPNCPSCKGIVEDAEHVFFICPRFVVERQVLANRIGHWPTPEDIVISMLSCTNHWAAVSSFSAEIMINLRRLERERRGQ
jgi:hypothetical protein